MDKRGRAREVSPSYEPGAGTLNYEDYLRMPAGLRYELVEGDIRMVPSPSVVHQDTSERLEKALMGWVESSGQGIVHHGPLDVVLSEHVVVQPDILFVSKAQVGIIGRQHVTGAPDLVVEILSPSTEDWDRVTKRRIYARYGVKEFWMVDPEGKTVEVARLQGNQLVTVHLLSAGSTLASPLLPGFELDVARAFPA